MMYGPHKNCFALQKTALVAATLAFAVGCGGAAQEDNRPERVLFGGTAKLNGAAVQNALITFHPVGANGNGASGKTDDSGHFVMSTFESGDGVVPGEYQVTVVKVQSDDSAGGQNQIPEDDPAYDGAPAANPVEETNKLPPKFEDPATSGVTVSVKEANEEYELEFK